LRERMAIFIIFEADKIKSLFSHETPQQALEIPLGQGVLPSQPLL